MRSPRNPRCESRPRETWEPSAGQVVQFGDQLVKVGRVIPGRFGLVAVLLGFGAQGEPPLLVLADRVRFEVGFVLEVPAFPALRPGGSWPRPEHVFFGVGPASIGVPYRYRVTDRERPLIAAEDAQTGKQLEHLLTSLALAVTRYQIDPDRADPPLGGPIVVCGPKSAQIGADLMARDPALRMIEKRGRWLIEDLRAGDLIGSPADDDPLHDADLAYLARHLMDGRVIHIAGIHAIGSLGAAHYLTSHLVDLFAPHGGAALLSCDP